ncbi:hypothetical protein Bbelb_070560 [Branchiostoma belcheri]|nr:hypothetical protein Bbelb_070560 [Branchiostoma belcheri]
MRARRRANNNNIRGRSYSLTGVCGPATAVTGRVLSDLRAARVRTGDKQGGADGRVSTRGHVVEVSAGLCPHGGHESSRLVSTRGIGNRGDRRLVSTRGTRVKVLKVRFSQGHVVEVSAGSCPHGG